MSQTIDKRTRKRKHSDSDDDFYESNEDIVVEKRRKLGGDNTTRSAEDSKENEKRKSTIASGGVDGLHIRLTPYEPVSFQPRKANGAELNEMREVRGTIFPDQYSNWLRYAMIKNQAFITKFTQGLRKKTQMDLDIPPHIFSREIIRPYLRHFRFLLEHSLSGNGQSSPSIGTYFLQIGQLYWLMNRSKLDNYDYSVYRKDTAAPCLSNMPNKVVTSFTQVQTIDALAELTFVSKHVPHTPEHARLFQMVLVQATNFLMGPGSIQMFDGYHEKRPMAILTTHESYNQCYVASASYVLLIAIRFFYLMRLIAFMNMEVRIFDSEERDFIIRYNLSDKIKKLVIRKLRDNKEFIEQKKTDMIYMSRISQGDLEISRIMFPGQELPTNMIQNLHPRQSTEMLAKLADFNSLTLTTLVDGVAGLDIAESIVLAMFFSHISGNDTPIALQSGFVIENQNVDSPRGRVKILDSQEPLLVQLDARYRLVWKCKQIDTSDIYETLAGWLAIVYLHLHGVPERTVGCLYNTFREFCGNNVQLPADEIHLL